MSNVRVRCRMAPILAAMAVVAALCSALPVRAAETGSLIAAAASLRFALTDIVAEYRRTAGGRTAPRITYGATGTLVRQIENGAPFGLFLAADATSPARLAEAGLTQGAPVVYARGRLALVARSGGTLVLDETFAGLAQALARGDLRRFAIANPELAPYGAAARDALRNAGLLERMTSRLVIGENVGQTTQFVASGAADAGIVSLSLARAAPGLSIVPLPADQHAPIIHAMVLTNRAASAARDFFGYLQSAGARAILERHGFAAP